jgi:hypothetical protein
VGRAAALLALALAVGVYYSVYGDLGSASLWWETIWIGFGVLPLICAFGLVLLPAVSLPAARLAAIGGGFLAATLVLGAVGAHTLANFGKLGAMTFLAWAFLSFFEDLSWVVLVACIIPWVDAYSVWRGPTKAIVHAHVHVFTAFSFAFPVANGSFRLGLPDLFFFSLFLGAAARFGLRVRLTWLALTLSFGTTMVLAIWIYGPNSGLPALPLLSVGFLLPNADLLWRRLRPSVRTA